MTDPHAAAFSETRSLIDTGVGVPATFVPILPDPKDWDDISAEIQALAKLREDWDGMGASAPDPAVVDSAVEWAAAVEQSVGAVVPSSVSAGPGGEVILTWQRPGIYREVEFSRPGVAEVFSRVDGLPPEQFEERGEIRRAVPLRGTDDRW